MAEIDYGYLKDDDGQRFYPITNYEVLTNKPDLSQLIKKTDIIVSNKIEPTKSSGDLSLMKFKSLGVKDYTPQTDPSYDQNYHLENPAGFMNDMQSIIKGRDGTWHVWYLQNPLFQVNGEGGTSNWQHATSTDNGIHWVNDPGLAIKADLLDGSVKWGSVATGSVVISDGTIEGTKDGDFVAFFSSYGAKNCGGQSIWVAVSKDNGVTFQSLYEDAVLPNHENFPDFRDPFVMKHDGKWVMYTAEGQKIGTYNSTNGKNWVFAGGTMTTGDQFSDGKDYGLIECPYVTEIKADDGTTHWAMFFGCNDFNHGHSTGTSYLIGTVDENGNFTKTNKETVPVRIDIGTDYYGSNFGKVNDATLITSSWMNNWGYATVEVKGIDGTRCAKGSTCALFRHSTLHKDQASPSGYTFKSVVLPVVNRTNALNDDWQRFYDIQSGSEVSTSVGNSRVIDYIVKSDDGTGYFTLVFEQDDNSVVLFVDIAGGVCHIKRSSNGNFDNADYNIENNSISFGQAGLKEINMTVYLDTKSIEIEFANTGQIYSILKWGKRTNPNTRIKMQAGGRNLVVNNKVYSYK
ncbi:GH32 family (SacC) [Fructobacillus fructosus]|uniref:GH32 family (SacC) n=1 Tax=Fructobacillus fructosus TaxID=1631 RepID=A0ABN9YRJ3_9LACO|nr:GH32 family (SacC) [Fructobacillus fructosus]